jgi:hypothetical protein
MRGCCKQINIQMRSQGFLEFPLLSISAISFSFFGIISESGALPGLPTQKEVDPPLDSPPPHPHRSESINPHKRPFDSIMMNNNIAMPIREMTAASSTKSENSHEGGDGDKPNRKRKRKGLGNWTRTTLACNRCRKMKIRVSCNVYGG